MKLHKKVIFNVIGRLTSWAYWAEKQEWITNIKSYIEDGEIIVEYDLDMEYYVEDMKKLFDLTDEDIDEMRKDFIQALTNP